MLQPAPEVCWGLCQLAMVWQAQMQACQLVPAPSLWLVQEQQASQPLHLVLLLAGPCHHRPPLSSAAASWP